MDYAATLSAVRSLSREDQVRLIQDVWDETAVDIDGELDEETKWMLDERIADMEENPDDEVPLDQALAEIRAGLRS